MIRRFHSRLSVLFIAFVVMVSGRASPPTSTVPSLLNHQGRMAVQGANDNGSEQFKFALIHEIDSDSGEKLVILLDIWGVVAGQ